MDLIKYDMTDIWAVAGDVVAPDTAKIRAGWGVEVVPRQWWNWFENRQDNNIAYMLQKGFPEWDATTQYIINKSYVQRNGIVYKATATSTNSDPVALTSWVRAFADSTPYLERIKGVTPTNSTMLLIDQTGAAVNVPYGAVGLNSLAATTQAGARSVIDAQQANSNLSALSAVTAGANALPYFTGTTTMGIATLTAFGRSIIAANDAPAVRTLLQLGTGAISNVTTSRYDVTPGALMKVGDFGLGLTSADPIADCNNVNVNGFFTLTAATANRPTGTGAGGTLISTVWDANTRQQLVMQAGRMWQRQGGDSTGWSGWVESWTTNNLVKTTSTQDPTVGNMLKVGDFGFGKDAVLITDPDTVYRGSGFYDVAPATSWAARPIAGWTRIFHQSHGNSAGFATQIMSGDFASAGVLPRIFIRYCINGSWTASVELYHTGNTAQIVAQVQAGIQPTLDAKVNKAGDSMTGQLALPSIYVAGNSGSGGVVYMKALSSTAPGGMDVTFSVDSPTANTNNGGRLIIAAASTYINNALTVTGAASFQNALSSSGLITGAGLQINGNATVTNTITTTTLQVNGGGTIGGTVNLAGGTAGGIQVTGGVVSIFPAGNTAAGSAHVWFKNTDGSTRGILYGQNGNVMTLNAGNSTCANFYPAGNASFNGISTSTISASGRITGTDCVFSGNVYSGSGNSFLQTDGNVYGGAWGGYLSSYLGANMITPGNLRGNLASIRAGELGSYALLQHPGGANIGPNGSVAGTDMSWATAAGGFDERVGSGTWVVMGRISTGNKPVATTLCMRYA